MLSVIHARRRARVRIIHAGGMPAFSSSGAEDANLFTEVLLKGGWLVHHEPRNLARGSHQE